MTAVVGLSSDALIDRPRMEAVHAEMSGPVFEPALKEVVRQLWKLAREVLEAERVEVLRRRLKQITVIADRFGLKAVRACAQAIADASAGRDKDDFPAPQTEELWERLRDALWETQALIESGQVAQEVSQAA
ncbi:MAG: hypothetical protein NXI21_09120 [Alphaproteobacteria bacterium]|nr:hypothetical protein [Alphaproteobacteria bacterium]